MSEGKWYRLGNTELHVNEFCDILYNKKSGNIYRVKRGTNGVWTQAKMAKTGRVSDKVTDVSANSAKLLEQFFWSKLKRDRQTLINTEAPKKKESKAINSLPMCDSCGDYQAYCFCRGVKPGYQYFRKVVI